MDSIFNENNFYWCSHCENYSMDLTNEDICDYVTHLTFTCCLCGEHDFKTVDSI